MPAASFQPQTIDLSASFVQLIRTALANPKVTFDKTGLKATDANGGLIFDIDALLGTLSLTGAETLIMPAFDPLHGTSQTIKWVETNSGGVVAQIQGYRNPANLGGDGGLSIIGNPSQDASRGHVNISATSGDQVSNANIDIGTTGGNSNRPAAVKAHATGQFTTPGTQETSDVTIIDETGLSSFLQPGKNLSELTNPSTARTNLHIAWGQSQFTGVPAGWSTFYGLWNFPAGVTNPYVFYSIRPAIRGSIVASEVDNVAWTNASPLFAINLNSSSAGNTVEIEWMALY